MYKIVKFLILLHGSIRLPIRNLKNIFGIKNIKVQAVSQKNGIFLRSRPSLPIEGRVGGRSGFGRVTTHPYVMACSAPPKPRNDHTARYPHNQRPRWRPRPLVARLGGLSNLPSEAGRPKPAPVRVLTPLVRWISL